MLRSLALALLIAGMLAAGVSHAAILTITGSSLDIELVKRGGTANIGTIPQTPEPAPVFVFPGGGFFENTSYFAGSVVATQPFSPETVISTVGLSFANQIGSFAPGGGPGGGFGGSIPFAGNLHIGFIGGTLALQIPLGAGQSAPPQTGAAAGLMVTATGQGWTTAPAVVTGLTVGTPSGGFTNTVTITGSDARSAGHKGSITLVTPLRVTTDFGNFAVLFSESFVFVPEPSVSVLLGVAAALGWVGRKRLGARTRNP